LITPLLIGCQVAPTPDEIIENQNITITDILNNPDTYIGKHIHINGAFYGWSGKCMGMPPKTKSDWMLQSDNACIYVVGPVPQGMSARLPARGIGKTIEVTGTVLIDDEHKPYIDLNH